MKRSKELAMHQRRITDVENGKFVSRVEPRQVRVMARAEGYAMVRLPGCMPFVVSEKDLLPVLA